MDNIEGIGMTGNDRRSTTGRRASDGNRLEPLHVLLVEDTPGDALMAARALEKTEVSHKLETLRTGQQVMPYLEGIKFRKERLPDVMILDLGMPGMDGFDVLAALATAAPEIKAIPIILLTGYRNALSSDYRHIDSVPGSESLKILGYMEKPCQGEVVGKFLRDLRGK